MLENHKKINWDKISLVIQTILKHLNNFLTVWQGFGNTWCQCYLVYRQTSSHKLWKICNWYNFHGKHLKISKFLNLWIRNSPLRNFSKRQICTWWDFLIFCSPISSECPHSRSSANDRQNQDLKLVWLQTFCS